MLKGFVNAELSCGCRLSFREGVEGSPVTVVIDRKAPGCVLTLHVAGMPIFDYREAKGSDIESLQELVSEDIISDANAEDMSRAAAIWDPDSGHLSK